MTKKYAGGSPHPLEGSKKGIFWVLGFTWFLLLLLNDWIHRSQSIYFAMCECVAGVMATTTFAHLPGLNKRRGIASVMRQRAGPIIRLVQAAPGDDS